MNDEKRVALVEELEEALYGGWMFRTGDSDERLTIKDMTPGIRRSLVSKYRNIPEQAAAIMPIIDAMLAERDIDAMLNAVHGFPSIKVWEIDYLHGTIGYACEIDNTVGHPTATGTGPTRVAAVADACKRALEGRATNDR
jgi:hypothetical protein